MYRICENGVFPGWGGAVFEHIKEALEEFDMNWVTYEQLYVIELMFIESDARRFITQAIEIEKEISTEEIRQRAKGKIMFETPQFN